MPRSVKIAPLDIADFAGKWPDGFITINSMLPTSLLLKKPTAYTPIAWTPAQPTSLSGGAMPARLGLMVWLALFALVLTSPGALAAPEGGKVRQGDASIEQDDDNTNVRQLSRNAVIDWRSFNVARHESVNFIQPSSDSLTINAIHDARPTDVRGRITANGRVALLNPNGVIFGPHSVIDVGGLLAGAVKFERIDEAGRLHTSAGAPGSMLIHGGLIQASQSVALVGTHLENSGTILAQLGSVELASGNLSTVDFDGSGLIHLGLSDAMAGSLNLTSTSRVEAGTIAVSIRQTNQILDELVNVEGVLRANSVRRENGRIVLAASNQGIRFDAIAEAGVGGQIDVLSDANIAIDSNAQLRAPGGQVRVGGSWQGGDRTIAHARNTVVRRGAHIDVSGASASAAAGEAVVWSDGLTHFNGHISAQGRGGRVEVSGQTLSVGLGAQFDLSPDGLLLFDPAEVTISDDASTCMGIDVSAPIPTDTADCTIQSTVLEGVMSGTVTVQASQSIVVNNEIAMTAGVSLTLETTVEADNSSDSIALNSDLTTSGGGEILISTPGNISGTGALASADTITLEAGGSITASGGITAPTVSLASTGAIGTIGPADVRVIITASDKLTLTTSAPEGHIYTSSTDFPAMGVFAGTGAGRQQVDLDFTITGSEELPTNVLTAASMTRELIDDQLTLSIDARGGSITLPTAALNLSTLVGTGILASSTLNLKASNQIMGTSTVNAHILAFNADNVTITAGVTAGLSAVVNVSGNVATGIFSSPSVDITAGSVGGSMAEPLVLAGTITSISLRSIGNIYLSSNAFPTSFTFDPGAGAIAIRDIHLTFTDAVGDITLPALAFRGIDTTTLSVTTTDTTAGNITVGTTDDSNITGADTITLDASGGIIATGALTATTSATLMADGSLTGTGAITAPAITINARTGSGGIGTGTGGRVNANASTTLSLMTGGVGAAGSIYLASTVLPNTSLTAITNTGSGQTVDLAFSAPGVATIQNALTTAIAPAGDTVELNITSQSTIFILGEVDLNPATTTSTITLDSISPIAGTATLSADNIAIKGTSIGAPPSDTGRSRSVTANATNTLSLDATGVGNNGQIYLASTVLPNTSLKATTHVGSSQPVNLDFNLDAAATIPTTDIGDVGDTVTLGITTTTGGIVLANAINLIDTVKSTLILTAAAGISGAGAVSADTITLTANGGAIGTGTGDRVNANASDSLSLTTTGALAAGNIYLASNGSPGLSGVLPSMSLKVSTDLTSGQTVDLDFNLGAAATIPAMLTIANAGDTITLDISTTTGGIDLAHAINLNPVNPLENTDSTLTLTATTATAGSITGAGILSADSITLSAVGIGTAAVPVRLNAGMDLGNRISLTTTGDDAAGNIYISQATSPTNFDLTTNTGSGQTVQILELVTGNLMFTVLPTGLPTVPNGDSLITGYDVTGNITLNSAVSIIAGTIRLNATGDISGAGALTAPILNLSAGGNLTATGALTAPVITLTAARIGTGTGDRVNANASDSLSLTTTGALAAGNIYLASNGSPGLSGV
ncbi:MAG: filamentous hemagglutinin N-terminal domain-containing protein, partial [Gammaproteobacteria bacterium]|nr:filamentous hemagglutinin N-terminal domain-containing protein [Gammaproteobacteria bacterium]